MADISVVPASVKVGDATSEIEVATAGATITEGDALFLDTTTNKYLVSDCTAAGTNVVERFALSAATNGNPVQVMRPGTTIDFGATLTVAEIYVLSEAGAIAPVADLASADYVTIVGYGESTSLMLFDPNVTGYVKP